mmetsp:Transcript_74710/g.178234  ORF Transcript_74710/g.178234 Transcript_74710/m.178234 type:complete len:333 (+) Transcript_74710:685-1683(+)
MEGINPACDQGVVAVLQALIFVEECIGSTLIKHLAILLLQGNMHHGESGSSGLVNPLPIGCTLDSVGWPIRTIGRALRHVELTVLPQGHGGVPSVGAHAEGQHRVEAVQADDPKEVPRGDLRLVQQQRARVPALLHVNAHIIAQELQIPLRDQGRDTLGLLRHEEKRRLQEVAHRGQAALVEHEDPHAQGVHVPGLGICQRIGFEGEALGAADGSWERSHVEVRRGEKTKHLFTKPFRRLRHFDLQSPLPIFLLHSCRHLLPAPRGPAHRLPRQYAPDKLRHEGEGVVAGRRLEQLFAVLRLTRQFISDELLAVGELSLGRQVDTLHLSKVL